MQANDIARNNPKTQMFVEDMRRRTSVLGNLFIGDLRAQYPDRSEEEIEEHRANLQSAINRLDAPAYYAEHRRFNAEAGDGE